MTLLVPEQFRAALNYLLIQDGRGAQTRLADQLDIDRGYLNAIVRGRKNGAEGKRCQIAAHFGMVYEDMLALGRRILESDDEDLLLTENKEKIGDAQDQLAEEELPAGMLGTVQKAIDVLKSDTVYSDLLDRMIDVFYNSIRLQKGNQALRILHASLESRLSELEQQHLEDTVNPCLLQDDHEPEASSLIEDD